MARKATRSRADQPQSNTALIVFLVFSILLNLALGVFLYLAQEKIETAVKEKGDAVAAQKKQEDARNAATNVWMPLLRAMIGDTTLTTEQINAMKDGIAKAQSDLPTEHHSWYGGKVWTELTGRGDKEPGITGWTPTTGKPVISLIDKVRQLNEQLTKNTEKLKLTEASLAKVTKEFGDYKKEWNDLVFTQRLKAAQDSMEADKQNKLKQKDEVIAATNKSLSDVSNEVEKSNQDMKKNYETQIKANQAWHADEVNKEAAKFKEKLARFEQDRLTSTNVPKARVVSYEPGTDMAIIDLGSSVKLPIGLTFSVHDHDVNGQASPRKKAEVVVVKLLGEQLAQVRITRMARPDAERIPLPRPDFTQEEERRYWDSYFTSDPRDFIRTTKPLYKGDLLFNVVWDPLKQTNIALVGEFDLDGDGTDDIQSLIALLRAQGGNVVLYQDKANGYKPKGKIDHYTDLVVLGEIPDISIKGAGKQQVAVNRATEMLREGIELEKQAIEKGIRLVQVSRFLSEMGISIPLVLSNKAQLQVKDAPAAAPAGDAPAAPAAQPPGSENK
ncbi:MAG: hypothetical protein U0796_07475 [Gemmatales bacterium]